MSRERLQLPEPAATLWRAVRDPLRRALASGGAAALLTLGGGTVLAARWKHRTSRDIDVVVPAELDLWGCAPRLNTAMSAAGADACGYNPKRNQYRAAFMVGDKRQTVEIWPHDPEPGGMERAAEVDGCDETVLATAQILKGKLERGEDALVRDVVDVITVDRVDPVSLEIAVNAITPSYTRLVSTVWDSARATIAQRAEAEFGTLFGVPETLGPTAAAAIRSRMYERIALGVEDGRVVAMTVTAGGTTRRRLWTPADVVEEARTTGLDAALRGMRHDPVRLLTTATAAATRGRNGLLADCRGGSVPFPVAPRIDEPATPPAPAGQRRDPDTRVPPRGGYTR